MPGPTTPAASTALKTDHYEFTMLAAALRDGIAGRRACFEVFARTLPVGRSYGVFDARRPARAGGDRMTARYRHGLVVGKFYPPHVGHDRVVDEAAASCDHVSAIVAAGIGESAPLPDRVAWLSATHAHLSNVRVLIATDDHSIDYEHDTIWAAQWPSLKQLRRAASSSTDWRRRTR